MESKNATAHPHIHPAALEFYATALLAEKLYASNVFGDNNKEDIAYYNLCQNRKNNPRTAWEITVKRYPYLEIAEQEVLDLIDIPSYALSYWQLLDAVVWSLEKEPQHWQEIILAYVAEFLALPVTPRNKFRQAIQVIERDRNLRDRRNHYSWSTRHLVYKFLKNKGYTYLNDWNYKNRAIGYWLQLALYDIDRASVK